MPRARGGIRALAARNPHLSEDPVLDVIYIVATLAIFALVALVAKGVEKL